MTQKDMFPGYDLGLSMDAVIDPQDTGDEWSLWRVWQHKGFAGITDIDALALRQWLMMPNCPLGQDSKDHYLDSYAWEALNRERMLMINQFFRLHTTVWGIRLAIRKNPNIRLVHLGEREFGKVIGSKPQKLLRPSDGKAIWTKQLLPQRAFRGCLYSCLNDVRKKGGVGYLLGRAEQLNMKWH
ncbi:MAG: hypothetical protein ACKKL4_00825 [Patescibacteria group bacterium]